jgi:hypothetical protein
MGVGRKTTNKKNPKQTNKQKMKKGELNPRKKNIL